MWGCNINIVVFKNVYLVVLNSSCCHLANQDVISSKVSKKEFFSFFEKRNLLELPDDLSGSGDAASGGVRILCPGVLGLPAFGKYLGLSDASLIPSLIGSCRTDSVAIGVTSKNRWTIGGWTGKAVAIVTRGGSKSEFAVLFKQTTTFNEPEFFWNVTFSK